MSSRPTVGRSEDPRGAVAEFLKRHGVRNVKVDKIGVGAYFETHLRDLGFKVMGVNVGEAPRNRERFANLKAELYWGLRERFETGEISRHVQRANDFSTDGDPLRTTLPKGRSQLKPKRRWRAAA